MRFHRSTLMGCVALACGACTNPAPSLPGQDAGPARAWREECDAAGPPLAPALLGPQSDEPVAADGALPALGECSGTGPRLDEACASELPGWYGLAYDFDVTFEDGAVDAEPSFAPGRGRLRILLKAAVQGACPTDAPKASELELCGLELPALTAADGGKHPLALATPLAHWPAHPRLSTQFRATDLGPRAQLSHAPLDLFLGVEPAADSGWPTYADTPFFACGSERQGSACFPDADGDGEPGITIQLPGSADGEHGCDTRVSGLPSDVAPSPGPRVSALYLGLRTQLRGSFTFDPGCEAGVGTAEAEDVALRVLDCSLDSGARCNPRQATFVDQHAPTFKSQGGRLVARRLAPSGSVITCQDVRTAFEQTDTKN